MEENKGILITIDLTRELKKADEIEVNLGDYEFVLKNGKTYFVKKNKYPNTYEECCKVLFPNSIELGKVLTSGYNCELLKKLGELLICRDAYWKIAGEQMGLGKPWEPDWDNGHVEKYYIYLKQNEIEKSSCFFQHHFFAFPTEEILDAFYENFKNEIEACKELL